MKYEIIHILPRRDRLLVAGKSGSVMIRAWPELLFVAGRRFELGVATRHNIRWPPRRFSHQTMSPFQHLLLGINVRAAVHDIIIYIVGRSAVSLASYACPLHSFATTQCYAAYSVVFKLPHLCTPIVLSSTTFDTKTSAGLPLLGC